MEGYEIYWEIVRVVACIGGAFVYSSLKNTSKCWKDWFVAFILGFCFAVFGGPVAVDTMHSSEQITWIDWKHPHTSVFTGFLLGIVGNPAVRGVLLTVEKGWFGPFAQKVLMAWFGIKEPPQRERDAGLYDTGSDPYKSSNKK